MDSFVTPEKKNQKNQKSNKKAGENIHMIILVSAKKVGLSLTDLREFTMQNLMDFIDLWVDGQSEEVEAEQEDIDNFYKYL